MTVDRSRPDRRFWRRPSDADVNDEIAFHIETATAEGIRAGLSPDAARADALQRFGDINALRTTLDTLNTAGVQMADRKELLGALAQDFRFGIRQLRKNPGFTIVALLTLALGIGANTAIFSLVDSVLFHPIAFAESARVYNLTQQRPNGGSWGAVPVPNYLEWQQRSTQFAAIGAYQWQSMNLTGTGDPQRLRGNRASASFWQAEYAAPVVGRYYNSGEDVDGGPHVVVLSYPLWRGTFGGDRTLVGRTIDLDGLPYIVVGVAPAVYSVAPGSPGFWVPLAPAGDERQRYGDHELTVVGRLKPGATLTGAVADLDRIETSLRVQHPDDGVSGKVVTQSLIAAMVGSTATRQFLVLLGAVALVLLIACGNVANLLLARAASRRGEIAVRSALGASRLRIATQMLVESGVLAAGGAILGVAVAAIVLKGLVAVAPASVPRLAEATVNLRVLSFAILVSTCAGILFGLAPAYRASRSDIQLTLRDAGRDGRSSRDLLRGSLVVAEIAVALVLLSSAGLLLRSAAQMQHEASGFSTTNILTGRVALPEARYASDTVVTATFARILAAVRAQPGVASAALVSRIPIGSGGADCGITKASAQNQEGMVGAQFRSATPAYFSTIGTPLLRGRDFTNADQSGSPLVVVINAQLAHKLFGDADPIGQQVLHCVGTGSGYEHPAPRTVVGVIADVRANGLDQDAVDQAFYPTPQFFERAMTIIVRGKSDPLTLVSGIKRALATIDPLLPLAAVTTMQDVVGDSNAASRFTLLLLLLLGVVGLSLAAIGIYGIISYHVGQRTRELGVRIALGATGGAVRALVVRQGAVLLLAGIVIGETLAWVSARALSGMVYGVPIHDALTSLVVAVLLAATALCATLVPAMRATRIDPVQALRE